MKMSDDPLARLRAANPVPPEEAPSADSPQAVAMFERIVATPPDAAPPATVRLFRRSLRRRLWVLIPAAIVAGAASYAAAHHGRAAAGIVCWADANTGAQTDRGQGDLDAEHATEACDGLWAPGGVFNPTGAIQPPPLTACVSDPGLIAVVPDTLRPDTCVHLGLTQLADDPILQDDPEVLLEHQLSEALLSCHTSDEARATANELLVKLNLADWRISTSSNGDPCAQPAFDIPTETIFLAGG
jgi:hypothetical protein